MYIFSILLYDFSIWLYGLVATLLAFFKPKAKQFVQGRNNWRSILNEKMNQLQEGPIVWMHCASLGEFEQGRPILAAIRKDFPHYKLLLTFFSPSGYEPRKNYEGVDIVQYLPLDKPQNARDFITIVQPQIAIFVKYEFWYHYLSQLHKHEIPTYLIAANFQPRHPFFKWYGNLHRKMLSFFTTILVQNEGSKNLLQTIGINNVVLAGDPRFDRAHTIASSTFEFEQQLKAFIEEKEVIVAGSTWEEDVKLLASAYNTLHRYQKLIIAPHNIDEGSIHKTIMYFKEYNVVLWSEKDNVQSLNNADILIVDTIGLLAYLYRYGSAVWIGGGFNKSGIHNAVEAAVYGKPLFWGPNYERFQEAIDLVMLQAAFSTDDYNILVTKIKEPQYLKTMAEHAKMYVNNQLGATQKIIHYLSLK